MMTAGIVLALVGLFGLAGINYVAKHRKLPERLQLDQSDPIVLAAVRETDAEFPMLPPLLDPKIRRADELKLERLAADEKEKLRVQKLHDAERERVWRLQEQHAYERARLETLQALATSQAERAFFTLKSNVPLRADALCFNADTGIITMRNGLHVLSGAVALYGWDRAIEMAKEDPPCRS